MNTKLFSKHLDNLRNESRLRGIPSENHGPECVDMLSNDYLGLAARAGEFSKEFDLSGRMAAMTSSASRLLSRRQNEITALEKKLEELYGRPALLFNSGYHANTGIVSALNIGNTLFICDRLVHASVIDGLILGKCKFTRFRHNDMESLRMLLAANYHAYDNIVVIVESVYSMDGDTAPLDIIAQLKNEFPDIILYVDEAHGIGVMGPNGLGLAEETKTIGATDIIVGTFGKALASSGAFVSCNDILKKFLINSARPLIFSTAIPPVCAAWTSLMIEKALGMEEERKHLKKISSHLNNAICQITGRATGSTTQIIPLLTGDAEKAMTIAGILRENGFDALPIRRPTVPPKSERIRFSLSAIHSMETINRLVEVINKIYRNEPQFHT